MGNSFLYQALAGYLPGFHIMAIDDPNFGDPDKHFETIEHMASFYVKLILDQGQICEPYQVGVFRKWHESI